METKLDQGAYRISSYCCVCPSRLLSSGCIHRPVLPRWWQKWPVAVPGLTSTVNILGTHRMTRGVFPNRLSRGHCKGLPIFEFIIAAKRCGALIGWVETSVDSEGNYKRQKDEVTYSRSHNRQECVF